MIDARLGDCLGVLRTMPAESIGAVVTDPPAGIGFMGKAWDSFGGRSNPRAEADRAAAHRGPGAGSQPFGYSGSALPRGTRERAAFVVFMTSVMAECLRVARPGAHALVWALPRTSHWTALALEDAGWLIEDRIAHHFGQGFPKHRSKLKPATEDWWLCTKPGGAKWLNVDGCRVGTDQTITIRNGNSGAHGRFGRDNRVFERVNPPGRWPSNVVFTHHPDCRPCGERRVKGTAPRGLPSCGQAKPANAVYGVLEANPELIHYADSDGLETVPAFDCVEGCPVRLLDEQSGERKSGHLKAGTKRHTDGGYSGGFPEIAALNDFGGDSGGASRFFPTFSWAEADFRYCPKASRAEREKGLRGHLPCVVCGEIESLTHLGPKGKVVACHRNYHPTVKPLALMRWIVRLIAPPGSTILDPFAGSFTTGLAAEAEVFDAVLIESDPEYYELGRRRLAAVPPRLPLAEGPLSVVRGPLFPPEPVTGDHGRQHHGYGTASDTAHDYNGQRTTDHGP